MMTPDELRAVDVDRLRKETAVSTAKYAADAAFDRAVESGAMRPDGGEIATYQALSESDVVVFAGHCASCGWRAELQPSRGDGTNVFRLTPQ